MLDHSNPCISSWEAGPVIEWLLKDGRLLPTIEDVTHQLGQKLLEAGAPIWRFRLSMRTLHPLVAASTAVWERDEAFTQPIETSHGIEFRPEYIGSPYQIIAETRSTFRRRLEDALTDADHTVLHEIKARGGTDYFGLPLDFTEGHMAILACSTDRKHGFTQHDIEQFEKLASVVAPVAEVFSAKRVSFAVANAYLGARTGRRVLSGQITRGHMEKINAAILISDIRDWTGLNTRASAESALALANQYFEIVADAVEHNGGEVLKFIGDSVLAIFPLDGSLAGSDEVCTNALHAAQQAVRTARDFEPPLALDFGIGMHFGEVHYGNIGSRTRIDFTVTGQAVNTTARIERLSRKFNHSILFSEEFASRLTEPTMQIADEKLKGHDTTFRILATVHP